MGVYAAVIEWLPMARVEDVKVALPAVTVAALARVVVPSVNFTVPVGTLVPTPVIVAVSVTDWPEVDGLSEDVTAVVVVPCTDCDTEPLLLAKPPVPVKAAVIVCVATDKVLLVNVALPAVTATPDANVVAPSVKVTVPVGVPPDDEIVAVMVTDCPGPVGFADEVTAVVVAELAVFTVCVSVAVLGVPDVGVNVVLMEWLPAPRVLVVNVATPLVTVTPLASTVLPSLNDTVPDAAGVTVSVNVTLWPTVAGFADEAIATVGFAGVVLGNSGNVALV